MGKKLIVGSYVSLGLILLCFGVHLAGFQTDYWIVSYVNMGETELRRNLGIWAMQVHSENGTIQYDSPMFGRVEHFIALGIAALNTVSCIVIAIRKLSLCVGITSFITSTLMIIVSIYTYNNVQSNMATLRIRFPESAAHFTQSWSFYLVFVGIILNVTFTVAFMFMLLLNAEKKATKSDKGLGPKPDSESKMKYVYTVEHREENAYDNFVPELKEENSYDAIVIDGHNLENITHL
ncbi:hypothetical protein CHS0354_031517 [Potamilus streckersoni]|uniref:Uncharacterized protein n=1 Tax=Potamilus streckersoni TaxID=2493646 RepID=A0AAE0SHV5_9BIVA|nr:hypothetical protein CHS0354_031517 [Potamilus streckersoni]